VVAEEGRAVVAAAVEQGAGLGYRELQVLGRHGVGHGDRSGGVGRLVGDFLAMA
jgi:hypothetical protein